MTDDQIIEVVSAHKAGKQIQRRPILEQVRVLNGLSHWIDLHEKIEWDFVAWEYRVKPEPREWWLVTYPTALTDNAVLYNKDSRELAENHAITCRGKAIKVREVLE